MKDRLKRDINEGDFIAHATMWGRSAHINIGIVAEASPKVSIIPIKDWYSMGLKLGRRTTIQKHGNTLLIDKKDLPQEQVDLLLEAFEKYQDEKRYKEHKMSP